MIARPATAILVSSVISVVIPVKLIIPVTLAVTFTVTVTTGAKGDREMEGRGAYVN